jgi:hypothetical protein
LQAFQTEIEPIILCDCEVRRRDRWVRSCVANWDGLYSQTLWLTKWVWLGAESFLNMIFMVSQSELSKCSDSCFCSAVTALNARYVTG